MSGFIYAIRALDKVKIGFTSGSPGERLRERHREYMREWRRKNAQ